MSLHVGDIVKVSTGTWGIILASSQDNIQVVLGYYPRSDTFLTFTASVSVKQHIRAEGTTEERKDLVKVLTAFDEDRSW
jgi:hypothetical protein